jgi:ABC-type bacteriocin/lantibiotic exporter with double-glycine peptidase domain
MVLRNHVRIALAVCLGLGALRTGHAQDCGARAVARILHDLRMPPADLPELLKELNGADGKSMPSFPMLADALRRRGVTALFVKLDALTAIESTWPAILHVNNNHFAVYEGRVGDEHLVWWGPGSRRPMSWPGIERVASQSILVAAREPPSEVKHALATVYRRSQRMHHLYQLLCALSAVTVFCACYLCIARPKKSCPSLIATSAFRSSQMEGLSP